MRIGVLALQGAFAEHLARLAEVGIEGIAVRTPAQLASCDGLILPGGESTAITLIAERTGMWEPLQAWVASGRPTWGTCAGMIMLCTAATGMKEGGQRLLGGLHATAVRNYFGAQDASHEADVELADDAPPVLRAPGGARGVFIRAPALVDLAATVTPLAWVTAPRGDVHGASSGPAGATAGRPSERVVVAAREGALLATAFHPELARTTAWHIYFGALVAAYSAGSGPAVGGGGGGTGDSAPAAVATSGSGTTITAAAPDTSSAAWATPGTSAASSWRYAAAAPS